MNSSLKIEYKYFARSGRSKKGNVLSKTYYNENDEKHRDDGPAETRYFNNGNVEYEIYYENGKRHRDNGPAEIYYYSFGEICVELYFENGNQHRIGGPADISYYSNGDISFMIHFENNICYRKYGPAQISYHRNGKIEMKYYENGKVHRINGPAKNHQSLLLYEFLWYVHNVHIQSIQNLNTF